MVINPLRKQLPVKRLATIPWLLLLMLLAAPGIAPADDTGRSSCLSIASVTPFAPRGEVYVVVQASCLDTDFDGEGPIVAYLELLLGDLPPIGEDVRIYRDDPRRRETFVFDDLVFESGDKLLVRLVRFGEILGLVSLKVP